MRSSPGLTVTLAAFRRPLPAVLALAAAGLALYAYRDLSPRPFAADDYQWLLNVRGLSFGDLLARAFDAGSQTHFYRPLVWLLIWAQVQVFGLDPAPFHAVSLGLHLLNALLAGLLAWRLAGARSAFCIALAFVALHPAPFEAVVWVSAQSELLAAALLLCALHLWLPWARGAERVAPGEIFSTLLRALLASLFLGLALLAKESAAIGLGLLLLLGSPAPAGRPAALRYAPFGLPAGVTAAYLALQAGILARNEIVRGSGYGVGPQLILNPLRALGLVAAPLPGTQYGDAPWLPWAGAALAALVALDVSLQLFRGGSGAGTYLRLGLAVLLTLAPTAPFTSPPDSRYVYLTVVAVAALLAYRAATLGYWPGARRSRLPAALIAGCVGVLLAWWCAGELAAREARFAAASGPGGSLWRVTSAECAAAHPSRVIVVEPPLAPPHAEAIVRLSCGAEVRPVVVGRDGVEDARRPGALVIAFPGGSAQVER